MLKRQTQISSLLKRTTEDTFPKLLSRNRRIWGDKGIAVRKKRHGRWNEYTWEACYLTVAGIFRGMTKLGLEPSDRVAIIGDNDPEWFWAELAAQAAGAGVVGISARHSADETRQQLSRFQPKLIVAQDQEQIDKLLRIRESVPPIQKIVYWDEKGLRHYDDPQLMSLDELVRRGEEATRSTATVFEERLSQGSGKDVAIILNVSHASGTTEDMQVTHHLLLSSAETVLSHDPVILSDDYMSLISPAWFFEQVQGLAVSLLSGRKMNFAENLDTVRSDFREISPQTLTYPSRMWEGLGRMIEQNSMTGSRLKRSMLGSAMAVGLSVADCHLEGMSASVAKRVRYGMAELMEFRPLRDKHGLDRARVAYAAGNPVAPETARLLHAIGINLKHLYAAPDVGLTFTDPGPSRII